MASELDIRGVFNFRDLASATPHYQPERVYRSDGLDRTDRAGADAVAAIGIRRVLDLRSVREQTEEGMFQHPDIETISGPMVTDSSELGRQWSQGGPDPLVDHYRAMLDGSQAEIASAVAIVANAVAAGEPIVFHCTAGKDRTGLLTSLLLGLGGVDDEAIVNDFHASEAGVEQMRQWYETERGQSQADKAAQMGIDPAVAHHMMKADRSSMEQTLANLRATHGSFEAYAQAIGVTPEQITTLAELGRR